MIKEARWSGWVWVGECFFWYRPTRVVPDQRPLNGRCCCCCVSSKDRVSATAGTPRNLPEFEIAPGNTGDLLGFSWRSRKILWLAVLIAVVSVGRSSSSHAHLYTLQTSPALWYCMACHVMECGVRVACVNCCRRLPMPITPMTTLLG